MKNMKIKAIGTLVCAFAFLTVVGVASAASGSDLQPANTITYNEAVEINSTLTVANPGYFTEGVHIGSTVADEGGVTYFNGTIVNAAIDADGEDTIPVTFGDDVRIDGEIYRTEVGGDNPLKISDTFRPTTTDVYSLGTSTFKFNEGHLSGALTAGSLTTTGAITATGVVTATTLTYDAAQTRYWSISASEMDPLDETVGGYTKGSGCLGTTVDSFSAPVNLPQGATVTKLTVNYVDDGATTFAVDLKRSVNGTDSEMASIISSGDTSSYQSGEDASIVGATVDNNQYGYRVEILDDLMDGTADHMVCNVEVAFTVTSPLP